MIKVFSNEQPPEETTILGTYEIVKSLIEIGTLKSYSKYENFSKYKKSLLETLSACDKLLFVATDNTEVYGFLTTSFNSPKTISLICVSPDYQRQGIGKKLIHELQESETSLSAGVDSLKPNAINNLLESCGFIKGKGSVWNWKK